MSIPHIAAAPVLTGIRVGALCPVRILFCQVEGANPVETFRRTRLEIPAKAEKYRKVFRRAPVILGVESKIFLRKSRFHAASRRHGDVTRSKQERGRTVARHIRIGTP